MNIYTVLSFISFLIYIQAGALALYRNSRSTQNRVFVLLSVLFAVYAFFYSLIYRSETIEQVYFYDRIAALGWVFFPIVAVWFFLILTRSKSTLISILFFFFLLPVSFVSYYSVLTNLESLKFFHQTEGIWFFTPNDNTISYFVFVLYLIVSVLIIYYVLISWYFMSERNRVKTQARILIFALSGFFVLSFMSNLVLPFIEKDIVPAMAPVNGLFLVVGVVYVLFFLPSSALTPDTVYKLIVGHIKEFIFIADEKGTIHTTNHHTLSILKYNNYEISKKKLPDIFSDAEKIENALKSMEARSVSRQYRMDLISKNQELIPVLLYVIKVTDQYKRVQGYVFSCLDYRHKLKLREEVADRVRTEKNLSQIRRELELLVKKRTRELHEANLKLQQEVVERRNAEEHIKGDLQEKIELVQEVHHRVKNNIQMIISLVNMMCSHPKIDEAAAEKLREIAEKVRYISRIHEDFYSSPNLSNIPFSGYLKKSIGELYSNFGRRKDIVFKLNLRNENLDINQAIPLGIIFNELMINALKYAFTEGENPQKSKSIINVEFYKNDLQYSLIISDNGVGLPGSFKELRYQNIGFQLVHVLAKEHLKGKISYFGNSGTTFIINFQS